jgi:hypothetical protein
MLFNPKTSRHGSFIVGCPRSGTTLLQSLLASHSKVASFPESKFFPNLIALPIERSKRYKVGLVTPRLRSSLQDFLHEVGRTDLSGKLPRVPLISLYVKIFSVILSELAQQQGKQIWLEKTPDHLHYIQYIEQYFPKSKIIHLVRNGHNVIASLYEVANCYPDIWSKKLCSIDGCIERWMSDIETTRQNLHKENHFLVRYEDLVISTEKILRSLCSFLSVEFETQMIQDSRKISDSLIRNREKWKSLNREAISDRKSNKFESIFTIEQQNYILRAIKDVDLDSLSKGGTKSIDFPKPDTLKNSVSS